MKSYKCLTQEGRYYKSQQTKFKANREYKGLSEFGVSPS